MIRFLKMISGSLKNSIRCCRLLKAMLTDQLWLPESGMLYTLKSSSIINKSMILSRLDRRPLRFNERNNNSYKQCFRLLTESSLMTRLLNRRGDHDDILNDKIWLHDSISFIQFNVWISYRWWDYESLNIITCLEGKAVPDL